MGSRQRQAADAAAAVVAWQACCSRPGREAQTSAGHRPSWSPHRRGGSFAGRRIRPGWNPSSPSGLSMPCWQRCAVMGGSPKEDIRQSMGRGCTKRSRARQRHFDRCDKSPRVDARWVRPDGQALYSLWIFPHGACQIPIPRFPAVVRGMQLGRELGTAWQLLRIKIFLDLNDVLVAARQAELQGWHGR
jgi:hypothetical protein